MIYQKLDENDLLTIQKASEKTFTNYDLLGDFIPNDSFISIIKDLLIVIENLEEINEELEEDIQENYRPISREEELS